MKALILVLAALAVGVVGCGGSDPCGRASPCPNDQAATPSEITACRAGLDASRNATCYNQVLAYFNCAADNRVCTAGGTTDGALSSTKAQNNCRTQIDAATSCCASNATSSACKG